MLLNTIIGFILPWLSATILLSNKSIILLIAPVSSVVSLTINTLGFYFFWDVRPIFSREHSLSRLPFDLGLYPVLGCYFIYMIFYYEVDPLILVLLFSVFTTLVELIGVKYNRVFYRNGWNGYLTLLSYLFSYTMVYIYYYFLRQSGIL